MEFKIGDKVRVINMNDVPKTYGDMTNKMGVIKWNAPSEWGKKKYGIAFEDVKNHSSEKGYFYFSKDNLELVYNNILALPEIKEKKLTCVVHTKTKNEAMLLVKILGVDKNRLYDETDFINIWDGFRENTCYRIVGGKVDTSDCVKYYQSINEKIYEFSDLFAWPEEMLEPVDSKTLCMADGTVIGEFNTGGTLPTSELIKKEFNVTWVDKIALPTATETKKMVERVRREILKFTNAFPKEEKKLKFTFYVTDWVDINKTNGEKIPMKRTVAYIGSNTNVKADTSCPVTEYDERIGCLIAAAKISAKRSTEAKMMYNIARSTWGTELSWAILFELANTAFNDNFERAYKKFHNDNIRFEKKRLTCNFCGKVFETIEEKTKHENEHIQNKKNKREKYLIRKEAKRRLVEAEREGKIEQTMKELYKK